MNHQTTAGYATNTRGVEGYVVRCSCGWAGPIRTGSMGIRRAQNDAAEHQAEADR